MMVGSRLCWVEMLWRYLLNILNFSLLINPEEFLVTSKWWIGHGRHACVSCLWFYQRYGYGYTSVGNVGSAIWAILDNIIWNDFHRYWFLQFYQDLPSSPLKEEGLCGKIGQLVMGDLSNKFNTIRLGVWRLSDKYDTIEQWTFAE